MSSDKCIDFSNSHCNQNVEPRYPYHPKEFSRASFAVRSHHIHPIHTFLDCFSHGRVILDVLLELCCAVDSLWVNTQSKHLDHFVTMRNCQAVFQNSFNTASPLAKRERCSTTSGPTFTLLTVLYNFSLSIGYTVVISHSAFTLHFS